MKALYLVKNGPAEKAFEWRDIIIRAPLDSEVFNLMSPIVKADFDIRLTS